MKVFLAPACSFPLGDTTRKPCSRIEKTKLNGYEDSTAAGKTCRAATQSGNFSSSVEARWLQIWSHLIIWSCENGKLLISLKRFSRAGLSGNYSLEWLFIEAWCHYVHYIKNPVLLMLFSTVCSHDLMHSNELCKHDLHYNQGIFTSVSVHERVH